MNEGPVGSFNDQPLRFFGRPARSPRRSKYAIVIAMHEGRFLLGLTPGRGYVAPSGKIKPGESSEHAARRELMEEAAATADDLIFLGYFQIGKGASPQFADLYAGHVSTLFEPEPGSEAAHRRLATLDELPDVYGAWDDLMAYVFDLALTQLSV